MMMCGHRIWKVLAGKIELTPKETSASSSCLSAVAWFPVLETAGWSMAGSLPASASPRGHQAVKAKSDLFCKNMRWLGLKSA